MKIFIGCIHDGKNQIPQYFFYLWYDSYLLFFEENRKNIQITKRIIENRNESWWNRWKYLKS